jgi:hypothetical protein
VRLARRQLKTRRSQAAAIKVALDRNAAPTFG